MTGIYLQCEECIATIGGEEVCSDKLGLHRSLHETLRALAWKRGWTTVDNKFDYCPTCSEKRKV